MKTNSVVKLMAALAATGVTFSVMTAMAQVAPAASPAPKATINAGGPHLGYTAAQILQLAQARIGEATIIAYIKNSGNSYRLDADQIIYLRQQGLSDAVITAMLNQPKAGGSLILPTTPAPTVADTATQAAPDNYYSDYSAPYYYDPYDYYYPDYGWYAPLTLGWGWGLGGWGWGWHGGRYYRGFSGGWHGNGVAHVGGVGNSHAGTFGGGHVGGFGGSGHVGGFSGGHAGGFGGFGGGHGGGHR